MTVFSMLLGGLLGAAGAIVMVYVVPDDVVAVMFAVGFLVQTGRLQRERLRRHPPPVKFYRETIIGPDGDEIEVWK